MTAHLVRRISGLVSLLLAAHLMSTTAQAETPNKTDYGACSRDDAGEETLHDQGYWLAAADGGVFSFGQAPFLGAATGQTRGPVVAIEPHRTRGYYLASADGGVFTYGGAGFNGSASGASSSPVRGLSAESDLAYRLVNMAGEVFHFGIGVRDHGDLADQPKAPPVAGIAAPPGAQGDNYWLFTPAGEVFPFGGARSYGSTAGVRLNAPIVAMVATRSQRGYWLVAADGGVFAFGDAPFLGSAGHLPLNAPIVGMEPTIDGDGYWLAAADGGIFTFGTAKFFGSTGNLRLNAPIIGMAACRGPGRSYPPA